MSFAGEIQEILFDMAALGLFVFLFLAMSKNRRDIRLNFWTAGWLSVIAHFAADLWEPATEFGKQLQSCISLDALAIAGSCFIYSAAIRRWQGRIVRPLAIGLVVFTLLLINVATVGILSAGVLAALAALRQSLSISVVLQSRRQGVFFVAPTILLCGVVGIWMVTAVLSGQTDAVAAALLCEIYLAAAMTFLANGWHNSPALKTIVGGLVAWGAVFPVASWIAQLWPTLAVDREVWNLPKFCVAVGMILVMIEEDTRAASALGQDYRLLFENNPHAMWITEIRTLRILAVNQSALDLHGYTRQEFLQLSLTDLLHPDLRAQAAERVHSPTLVPYRASRHVRKDGREIRLDLMACHITFEGRLCRFVLAVDATEREALQRQLEHQAVHDPLTGLPNRTLLPDLLTQAVQHGMDSGEKLAVLSLDIDRFSRINDVYGLHIADGCIAEAARQLSSHLRSNDVLARTGGDEFTIVIAGLKSVAVARQAVSDLLQAFDQPLLVQGYKIQLPVSIGVAIGPDDSTDPVVLWRGAESARGEAKGAGGARATWFSAELRKAAEEQTELESYLRTRMNEGGLHMVYQPIYGADGRMRGMEALLRLQHPEFGVVSPAKLIPAAEAAGLIIPLGEWVIEQVCRQLLIWKSQDVPAVPVAINVSGLQIMHVDFALRLSKTLHRYTIDPRLIHIEVTESVAMRNIGAVTEQMAALAAEGIEFSIDDFGTGHSSLARLSELGASILKIDRSFIETDCAENAHSIVQAIITMAHTLGHRVVAEGVETAHQLTCLRQLGCDLFQGYLLSKPVPPDQVPALIAARHPAFESSHAEDDNLHLVTRALA